MALREQKPKQRGYIIVYYGPMFSGKTTALSRKMRIFEIAKKSCIVVSPSIDDRCTVEEKNVIGTHDAHYIEAVKCTNSSEIIEVSKNHDVVGIDEAQFFTNIIKICDDLRRDGKIVVVSMLNCDFQKRPFEAIGLLAICDASKLLTSICVECYNKALFSFRTSASTGLVEIGGIDKYKPLCSYCYDEETKKHHTST